MQYRQLGRTDMNVSTISFGAWAVGGGWGATDDTVSMATLNRAIELGVNFIDTADVYGDGHSEQVIGQLRRNHPGQTIYVATKAGRRVPQGRGEGYTRDNLNAWVERSLTYLGVEALDLLQLHTPPSPVFERPEVFGWLDDLVTAGKIRYYGVSVETVAQARRAVQYPNLQSVQIIFNMFRLKPADEFFALAREKQVGILARVPLASGLLTGKLKAQTTFGADDHRSFNREGQAFDKGETFSGVPYTEGLAAVERLRAILPDGMSLAQFALRWILMFPAVTCAIPGARRPEQEEQNVAAADAPPLTDEVMRAVREVYDQSIRAAVHSQW
jgi:aryl-alcohol dehydrogenase-like predicted oxidoreductase